MVGEHRNDLIAADGHKGTSGFYPSQPCPNWTLVPYPPSGNQYSYFPTSVATAELAAANAAGAFSNSASIFKKFDIMRVAWDRHSGGQGGNYSFADGHAKYEALGATLDPNNYQYGTQWLPNSAPWNTSPCS